MIQIILLAPFCSNPWIKYKLRVLLSLTKNKMSNNYQQIDIQETENYQKTLSNPFTKSSTSWMEPQLLLIIFAIGVIFTVIFAPLILLLSIPLFLIYLGFNLFQRNFFTTS
jgi:hypothetical protein